jgi:tetratricopeptide (TPR) repeat protein
MMVPWASENRADSYLCSFHVPKTGGTTFAAHARKGLGQDEFLLHGPFARVDRFFNDKPQLEELSDRQRSSLKVIHGHGASLAVAQAMVGRQPEFMVILRNPYERFVSGFHHFNKEHRDAALGTVSEERYLRSRGDNFYARTLASHFEGVSEPSEKLTLDVVAPILQLFKYILLTEQLTEQLPLVCSRYSLPTHDIEAKRVNKAKGELAISREDFRKENEIDFEIFDALAKTKTSDVQNLTNPFGYSPKLLDARLEKLWSDADESQQTTRAYDALVSSCRKTFRLQAAALKLQMGRIKHVKAASLLRERIEAVLPAWLSSLEHDESSTAHFWSGVMFIKERRWDEAQQYLETAVSLNSRNDNAWAHLAKVLHRKGRTQDAIKCIDEATAIRPDRPATKAIRDTVLASL